MKSIVYLTDDEKYEFDTVEELKSFVLPEAGKMSPSEIIDYLYEKILGFSVLHNFQIVNSSVGVINDDKEPTGEAINFDKAIFIDNLDTYLLSLCKYNVVVIFEEVNHRYYTKDVTLAPNEENYAIVNAHADEILKAWVGDAS